jgi:hypothetical protein
MDQRRWNWYPWIGFALCLLAFASYFVLFVKFPVTRDIPWASYLIFSVGVGFLFFGVRRPLNQAAQYRGKIYGPVLAILGLAVLGMFSIAVLHGTKQVPRSAGAPRVGQKAPDFQLNDTNDQPVTLASLLSTPIPGTQSAPKGVLLVFYRGYW